MKHTIAFLLITTVLASCAPSGKSPVDMHVVDEVQQRRITDLESQLGSQRQRSEQWQLIATCLGVGAIALLILGTSLGAKTRHDATALS